MNIWNELLQAVKAGLTMHVVTLIKAPPTLSHCIGQQILRYPDGRVQGCIVDASLTSCIICHLKMPEGQQAQVFSLPGHTDMQFFGDMVTPKLRALVFGGGHISQPLVEMLTMVGYSVTVADDRPDFANQARFPKADRIYCAPFPNAFAELEITSSSAVIIVTRGHQHDLACLRHALSSPAFYVGMIGSRRKVAVVFDSLKAEGVGESILQKVRAPIGLDLHAQTPAEIALSIAAEIISVSKGGAGLPLSRLARRNTID